MVTGTGESQTSKYSMADEQSEHAASGEAHRVLGAESISSQGIGNSNQDFDAINPSGSVSVVPNLPIFLQSTQSEESPPVFRTIRVSYHRPSGRRYRLVLSERGWFIDVKTTERKISFIVCSDTLAHVSMAVADTYVIVNIPGSLLFYDLGGNMIQKRESEDFEDVIKEDNVIYGVRRDDSFSELPTPRGYEHELRVPLVQAVAHEERPVPDEFGVSNPRTNQALSSVSLPPQPGDSIAADRTEYDHENPSPSGVALQTLEYHRHNEEVHVRHLAVYNNEFGPSIPATIGDNWIIHSHSRLILYNNEGDEVLQRESHHFVDIMALNNRIYGLRMDGIVRVHSFPDLNFEEEIHPPARFRNTDMRAIRITTNHSNICIVHIGSLIVDIYTENWQFCVSVKLEFEKPFTGRPSMVLISTSEILLLVDDTVYLINWSTWSRSCVRINEPATDVTYYHQDKVLVLTDSGIYFLKLDCIREMREFSEMKNFDEKDPRTVVIKASEVPIREAEQHESGFRGFSLGDQHSRQKVYSNELTADSLTMSWRDLTTDQAESVHKLDQIPINEPADVRLDLIRLSTTDLGENVVCYGQNIVIYSSDHVQRWSKCLKEDIFDAVCYESRIYILTESYVIIYGNEDGNTVEKDRFHSDVDCNSRLAVHDHYVYVLQPENSCITRIDLWDDRRSLSHFAKCLYRPFCIAVNNAGYITVGNASQMSIYTPSGKCIRDIELSRMQHGGRVQDQVDEDTECKNKQAVMDLEHEQPAPGEEHEQPATNTIYILKRSQTGYSIILRGPSGSVKIYHDTDKAPDMSIADTQEIHMVSERMIVILHEVIQNQLRDDIHHPEKPRKLIPFIHHLRDENKSEKETCFVNIAIQGDLIYGLRMDGAVCVYGLPNLDLECVSIPTETALNPSMTPVRISISPRSEHLAILSIGPDGDLLKADIYGATFPDVQFIKSVHLRLDKTRSSNQSRDLSLAFTSEFEILILVHQCVYLINLTTSLRSGVRLNGLVCDLSYYDHTHALVLTPIAIFDLNLDKMRLFSQRNDTDGDFSSVMMESDIAMRDWKEFSDVLSIYSQPVIGVSKSGGNCLVLSRTCEMKVYGVEDGRLLDVYQLPLGTIGHSDRLHVDTTDLGDVVVCHGKNLVIYSSDHVKQFSHNNFPAITSKRFEEPIHDLVCYQSDIYILTPGMLIIFENRNGNLVKKRVFLTGWNHAISIAVYKHYVYALESNSFKKRRIYRFDLRSDKCQRHLYLSHDSGGDSIAVDENGFIIVGSSEHIDIYRPSLHGRTDEHELYITLPVEAFQDVKSCHGGKICVRVKDCVGVVEYRNPKEWQRSANWIWQKMNFPIRL